MRSGAEHWPHRIAVEVRRGTLTTHHRKETEDETKEEEEEEDEEAGKADIKSNNPHPTGEKKRKTSRTSDTKLGMELMRSLQESFLYISMAARILRTLVN